MTRIYVNRQAIEANAHDRGARPVIRVDRDGVQEDGFGAGICGAARVVYSPQQTHDGAHVWIETDADVVTIGEHER